jgi:hypothetical protein
MAENIEVLPLEWLGGGERYHAADFVIEKLAGDRRMIWRLSQADFGTTYRHDFGGKNALDAAKGLAFTIHCRRIASWLAPVADGEPE